MAQQELAQHGFDENTYGGTPQLPSSIRSHSKIVFKRLRP